MYVTHTSKTKVSQLHLHMYVSIHTYVTTVIKRGYDLKGGEEHEKGWRGDIRINGKGRGK